MIRCCLGEVMTGSGSLQAATARRLLRFAAGTRWRKRAVAEQDTSLKGDSDADDDLVLAAVVAARADLIVTGDRSHLRRLAAIKESRSPRRLRPCCESAVEPAKRYLFDLCHCGRKTRLTALASLKAMNAAAPISRNVSSSFG
jgi:hypothetical protein